MKKITWLILSALLFATACGDDDGTANPDMGTTDGGADEGVTDTGAGGDGGTDMETPDIGVPPDAGMDEGVPDMGMDEGVPDMGMDEGMPDMGMDEGMPDMGMMSMASEQIAEVLMLEDGAIDPGIEIAGAIVTYTRPEFDNDVAGFFIQGAQEGPALFVGVDPTTLTPEPAVGDTVTLTVTELTTGSDARPTATMITGFSRSAEGADVSALVQDVTDVDVVMGLEDLTSELIVVSGTLSGDLGFAGTGHQQIDLITTGNDTGLRLRAPDSVWDALEFAEGCTATLSATPLGRFRATPQASATMASEITISECPAPTVVSAVAVDNTTVRVTFSADLDDMSVEAADFAFSPDLTPSAVMVAGPTVDVTVSAQTGGTDYTVTVTGVDDIFGTAIDAAMNTAMFTGVADGAMATVLFTEIVEGSGSNNKGIELTNRGDADFDLGGCIVERYVNYADSGTEVITFDAGTTLAAAASLTLCRAGIEGVTCDIEASGINHNGDDAYTLTCDGMVVDAFGSTLGDEHPDFSGMNSMGQALSGANQTLRRLCDVAADTDVTDAFDLGIQWDSSNPADPSASQNDVSGLGSDACLP